MVVGCSPGRHSRAGAEWYPATVAGFSRLESLPRVRGMSAWALGKIGGREARAALERMCPADDGPVRDEFAMALEAAR